jgi:hypothetical protein
VCAETSPFGLLFYPIVRFNMRQFATTPLLNCLEVEVEIETIIGFGPFLPIFARLEWRLYRPEAKRPGGGVTA